MTSVATAVVKAVLFPLMIRKMEFLLWFSASRWRGVSDLRNSAVSIHRLDATGFWRFFFSFQRKSGVKKERDGESRAKDKWGMRRNRVYGCTVSSRMRNDREKKGN